LISAKFITAAHIETSFKNDFLLLFTFCILHCTLFFSFILSFNQFGGTRSRRGLTYTMKRTSSPICQYQNSTFFSNRTTRLKLERSPFWYRNFGRRNLKNVICQNRIVWWRTWREMW